MKTPTPVMPSLLILLFVIAFAITPHVAIAQFVPTEIVYENSQEDVSATHARLEEFGDEIILAGDNRKIIRFEFEYFGKFEADGDETCVLRFYRNDGEALLLDDKAPGTLIYESQPFTLFPGYNTAVLQGISVEVPDKFTWTVKFDGLTGFSKDRAALVLRDPASIGKSFDDFWVRFGNGWGTWRFKGDPIANFACKATSEFDLSVTFAALERNEDNMPLLTIQGPRGQTVIVWASNNLKEWEPIALQVLDERRFTLLDEHADPEKPRYYRAALTNGSPIEMSNFKILPNKKTRLSVSGPRGLPFTVQASADFESWEDVFSLAFQSRPITIQDKDAADQDIRFYRILINNTVVQDASSIKETIITFPDDFVDE